MPTFLKIVGIGSILLAFSLGTARAEQPAPSDEKPDREMLQWTALPDLPDPLGVAGPVVGVVTVEQADAGNSKKGILVAGGANFPQPYWDENSKKMWHDAAWLLLPQKNGSYVWREAGRLDGPLGYPACVSLDGEIIVMGGSDGEKVVDRCFLLRWDAQGQKLVQEPLPSLPRPCAYGCATVIGKTIYLAGGQNGTLLDTAMNNFWRLDMSRRPKPDEKPRDDFAWEVLPGWPEIERANPTGQANHGPTKEKLVNWHGIERAFNITVAQNNGFDDCVYVISGRRQKPGTEGIENYEYLRDVYEFNPTKYDAAAMNVETGEYTGRGRFAQPWRQRADVPKCVMAGTAAPLGQSHIFVLSGADGSLMAQADALKLDHPGFPKRTWAYHTITNTWHPAGPSPANQVTTPAVVTNDAVFLISGEIKPRVRSPKAWMIKPTPAEKKLGLSGYIVIIIYLLGILGVGVYFTRKNKNTDDYFRGGQNIAWWVAGCSIFATMLSSITFLSVPGKAFAQDWVYFFGNMMILVVAPIAVYLALPFFRQIDATSAYEYLEKRFFWLVRLLASLLFTVFHIFRMAIVMTLAALALSTMADFSPLLAWTGIAKPMVANAAACVIIMGILSVIYCTLGGIEAVVWTDTLQTFVLFGGALICLVMMIFSVEGGLGGFWQVAWEADKFRMFNYHADPTAASMALWVVVIGGIGQNISSYTSDQAVVQRYMTTPSRQKAAQSIWTAAWLAAPASFLFFSLGTALFVFYKAHPGKLDPAFATDQIFPLFISRELPAWLAGLIVAGVFAAAQSTISTSMNSTSTAVVTDLLRPFRVFSSEAAYLRAARWLTLLFGLAGTVLGLWFIDPSILSLLDSFIKVLGMFMGVLGGLFALGILTRRAHGLGALVGVLCGFATMIFLWLFTTINGYLFAAIGITVCFVVGWTISLIVPLPQKSIDGLTIYDLRKLGEEPAKR